MKTHTITTYSFNELSDEAKEKALEDYRENNCDEIFWQKEMVQSVLGLFDYCDGVTLKDYALGIQGSYVKVSFEQDVAHFDKRRAIAWLENNLLDKLRIPFTSYTIKTSKRFKYKGYGEYYRAENIESCPFTGYCFDDDLIHYLIHEVKNYGDLESAFCGIAQEFEKHLLDEWEYMSSEEHIKTYFEDFDCQFLENGRLYK